MGSRRPRRRAAPARTAAVSPARPRSRSAFQRVSAYSSSTSERTVMPPPVPSVVAPAVAGACDQRPDHHAEVGPAVGADPAERAGVHARAAWPRRPR